MRFFSRRATDKSIFSKEYCGWHFSLISLLENVAESNIKKTRLMVPKVKNNYEPYRIQIKINYRSPSLMKLEIFYDIFDSLTLQTNYFQVCYKRQNIICMFKVNYKDVLMNILCIYVFFLRKK